VWQIATSLEGIGAHVKEEESIQILIGTLPEFYDNFVLSLRSMKEEELTLDCV